MKILQYKISDNFQIVEVNQKDELGSSNGYKYHNHQSIKTDTTLIQILILAIQDFDNISLEGGNKNEINIIMNNERIGIIDQKNKSKNIHIKSTIIGFSDTYQINADINSFTLFKRIFKTIISPALLKNSLRSLLDDAMVSAGLLIDDATLYLTQKSYSNKINVTYLGFEYEYNPENGKLIVLGIYRDYEDGYSYTDSISDIDTAIIFLQKDKENLIKLKNILEK